ncbi:hypothetical protein KR093_003526, partial [Drosophila rubida]
CVPATTTTTTCVPATTTTTTCVPATTTTTTCPTTTTTCVDQTTTTCTPIPCAPTTTKCAEATTTACPPVVTTKCPTGASASSSGKLVHSSLKVRPVAMPHGPLPEVYQQPMQMSSASSELNMDVYTSYVCRNKPDGFMLASLTSCNNYYICRYGKPLQVSCGTKYFNALKGICDLPENTRCVQP